VRVFLAGRVAVEVEAEGVVIDEKRFPGRQGRLLFAYLVAEQGRPVPRDELAEALWGETPPPTWDKALTVNVSKLRGLLAESGVNGPNTLTSAFGCYRLDLPEGTWVDVIAAADAAEEAEAALAAGELEKAKALATHAASLARPVFLPGEEGVWVDGKRSELADIVHRALTCLAEASLRTGDPSAAGKAAEEAISLEPYRESGYRRLMQAHAAAGNRAEALRVYERCRKLLAEELGAYPSPETESFYRELLATSPIETKAPILQDAGDAFGVRPKTDYAKSGDVHIAYQCLGEGPVNLVFVPGFVSHVEHFWEDPSLARFLRRLASFSRLAFFDKRGTGLSDRVSEAAVPTLEERMDDVRAIMDAVGFERAAIFAPSDAGSMAVLFAATYPERTTALVLYGTFAAGVKEPAYPWGGTPAEWDAAAERWREQWGRVVFFLDRFAPSKVGDERYKEWLGRLERLAASPGAAAMLARMNGDIDVRHVLPSISVPTLVLHRRGELVVPVEEGRFIAERIPGAKFVELDGVDHWPWLADTDSVIEEIQEFLTGAHEPPELDRVLATVLFTDIVDATQHAAVRSELSRFRGREIDKSGDGFFAIFDGPARAIRCACAIIEGMKPLGLDVRAGLHTGECELIGDKVEGVAVHMCARVAAKAAPGEVLVSRTVKDLVAGSGIEFVDRGVQQLDGIPDEWQLFAVKQDVGGDPRPRTPASRATDPVDPQSRAR
jgi:DNA-binding SARP family transcriptional activator/pimeloyl-ACP methyl ester carboxylesterase